MSKYSEQFIYDYIQNEKNYGIIVDYYESVLSSSNFMCILTYMSEERGNSGYAIGCFFANSCDDEDRENGDYFENGVMFYENDAEVIIDYQTFYNCLKLACDIHLEDYPDDKKEVEEKLNIIKRRYQIKD